MGVDITTDTAVVGGLANSNGFTNGDPQAAIPATEFEAAWCNLVTNEINYAIAAGGLTPTPASPSQLASSIFEQIEHVWARDGVAKLHSLRTHFANTDIARHSQVWRRTHFVAAAAQNTTQTFTFVDNSFPDNLQFWATWYGECVQTDSQSTYSKAIIRVSAEKSGGFCSILKSTTVDTDGGLGVTWSVTSSVSYPALRAVLPVAAGKTFNLSGFLEMHSVRRI